MKKKNKIITAALATVVLVAGVGAWTVSAVRADDQTPADSLFGRVAQILNVSEDNLSDAMKTARTEHIDEMLEEGKIDEEQASRIKERISESDWGGPMGRPRRGRKMSEEHQQAVAEFLGITVEELKQYRQDHTPMHEILEKYGKTREELHEYIQENTDFDGHVGDGQRIGSKGFGDGSGECFQEAE